MCRNTKCIKMEITTSRNSLVCGGMEFCGYEKKTKSTKGSTT